MSSIKLVPEAMSFGSQTHIPTILRSEPLTHSAPLCVRESRPVRYVEEDHTHPTRHHGFQDIPIVR